jgi:hypothetical protein
MWVASRADHFFSPPHAHLLVISRALAKITGMLVLEWCWNEKQKLRSSNRKRQEKKEEIDAKYRSVREPATLNHPWHVIRYIVVPPFLWVSRITLKYIVENIFQIYMDLMVYFWWHIIHVLMFKLLVKILPRNAWWSYIFGRSQTKQKNLYLVDVQMTYIPSSMNKRKHALQRKNVVIHVHANHAATRDIYDNMDN